MQSHLDHLNLLSLRLFLAVVDLGSIAEAGRKHYIAATAVTKRMQKLEDELGVQLLYRTPTGVSPSPAGLALARHVRNMSSLAERMRTEMTEYAEGARGHVRLIANASALIEYLTQELAEFMAAHPGIKIDLQEARSDQVVRAVRDGNADMGIYAPPVTVAPELEVYPYRDDRLVAVVPALHLLASRASISFAELQQHPFIGLNSYSSLAALLSQESPGGISHSFRVESNDVARWMVSKGLGVTIFPHGLVEPHEASLGIRAIPLADAWARRKLMLCVRDSKGLTAAPRALLQALQQGASVAATPT